ncbi:MAG: type IV pilus modification protein PilV [Gallionella sp.]
MKVDMKTRTNNIVRESGFSMIEILITLVIISLALLGSAGLQAYALKTNQGGQFRNQAAFLVSDIIERMEANKTYAVGLNVYDTALTQTVDCTANNCTPAQLAGYDVAQWQTAVASAVPQGVGTVTGVAGNPASYTVKVSWVDRQNNAKYAASAVSGVGETFAITSNITIGN